MGRSRTINFDRIFLHRHHYGVMLSVIFLVLLVGLAMLYQYQKPVTDQFKKLPLPQAQETTPPADEKTLIQDFIGSNLRGGYSPPSISVSKIQLPNVSDVIYSANWESRGVLFSAALRYNSVGGKIASVQLAARLPKNTVFTDNNYQSLVDAFFLAPTKEWNCRSIGTDTVCESLWNENKDVRGAGVLSPISNKPGTLVYVCRIPLGSELYNKGTCLRV